MIDKEILVTEYRSLVYHLISRTVYDRGIHEELFQEVFLQIFKGIPSFKGKSRLSTWIASVTLNTCFNYIRKSTRQRKLSMHEWLLEMEEVPAETHSPLTRLETEDCSRRIEAALNQLPNKYKMPLILFYFENYSYREISKILKCPMGTVKTNLYRGLKELRRYLGGDKNELL